MAISEPVARERTDSLIDLDALEACVDEYAERYDRAEPFSHIAIDDFLSPAAIERATAEFPDVDQQSWINYLHVNERKYGNADPQSWGPTLRELAATLHSPRFVRFLSALTGIEDLVVDDSHEGGGLHQSLTGGFVNIHADFTVHPQRRHWRRRVNLLLFFNGDWPSEYGGELELWSPDMSCCRRKITPLGNRAVIFSSERDSFHGHPEPLRCPPDVARRSLALYYFTLEDSPTVRSTEYRPRPGDGARAALIYLDKIALRFYDAVKRRFGISDRAVSRLLRLLEQLRPK